MIIRRCFRRRRRRTADDAVSRYLRVEKDRLNFLEQMVVGLTSFCGGGGEVKIRLAFS